MATMAIRHDDGNYEANPPEHRVLRMGEALIVSGSTQDIDALGPSSRRCQPPVGSARVRVIRSGCNPLGSREPRRLGRHAFPTGPCGQLLGQVSLWTGENFRGAPHIT
ncbi:hypothetical protein [Luteococcus japonicus]|uniref:hypothetical protein n=1 Tax=Luteococcus japonicus TaxID=33984 RepID=UPI003CCC74A9